MVISSGNRSVAQSPVSAPKASTGKAISVTSTVSDAVHPPSVSSTQYSPPWVMVRTGAVDPSSQRTEAPSAVNSTDAPAQKWRAVPRSEGGGGEKEMVMESVKAQPATAVVAMYKPASETVSVPVWAVLAPLHWVLPPGSPAFSSNVAPVQRSVTWPSSKASIPRKETAMVAVSVQPAALVAITPYCPASVTRKSSDCDPSCHSS